MCFYKRLEPYLNEKKMKKKELAAIADVKAASVSGWVNEGTTPRADAAFKIADYFGLSMRWLVLGEGTPQPEQEKQPINSILGLTQDEQTLLLQFRELGEKDHKEVLNIVKWKFDQKIEDLKRGENSSNLETA